MFRCFVSWLERRRRSRERFELDDQNTTPIRSHTSSPLTRQKKRSHHSSSTQQQPRARARPHRQTDPRFVFNSYFAVHSLLFSSSLTLITHAEWRGPHTHIESVCLFCLCLPHTHAPACFLFVAASSLSLLTPREPPPPTGKLDARARTHRHTDTN